MALLEAIARDIEALGARHPQLADFRAAKHFDREHLAIDYAFHTHASTHRGGWTSGVPNPDPDGIWLYIDLHDPGSTAQIDTQPVVPMIDVLGRKLMMLLLEGDAARPPAAGALHAILERRARAASPSDTCTGVVTDTETPSTAPGERIALDDLLARRPRSGRFVTEGWVQIAHHCPPCPPGAWCKPCEEVVWLSPVAGAYKDPLTRDQNLVVAVRDATRFAVIQRYRVVVAACLSSTAPDAPLTVELRGFERIP